MLSSMLLWEHGEEFILVGCPDFRGLNVIHTDGTISCYY